MLPWKRVNDYEKKNNYVIPVVIQHAKLSTTDPTAS